MFLDNFIVYWLVFDLYIRWDEGMGSDGLFVKMGLKRMLGSFVCNGGLEIGMGVWGGKLCLGWVIGSGGFKENESGGILKFEIK